MPSFGKALGVALVVAALPPGLLAQSSSQPRTLYTEAVARETTLRRELDAHRPDASNVSLLRRIRVLVTSYEDFARLFPASGYEDDALWQGASLAAAAFWEFGEAADRTTALRLFDVLTERFSASPFVKQVPAQIKRLTEARVPPQAEPLPAATEGRGLPAFASGSGEASPKPAVARGGALDSPRTAISAPTAALKAIRREVLPDALRITLELEREVVFHDERLDGPPRVFIDLQNTRAVDALRDSTIPFPDDVVRQVRVGGQPDSRTRVVLDLKDAARYSVYALYNPYRVVVDFERAAPGAKPVIPSNAAGTSWTAAPALPPAAPPVSASANTGGGFSLSRQLGLGIARIAIDPGHGGQDPGAKIRGLTEADLVLDVALRLEKLLLKQPGVEVVLTRRTNSYMALEERTTLANRAGADLFLSIHANASANTSARGVETYFLNFAPNPEAEAIAVRENAGSVRNMRQLPEIVRAIALNNKIDESRDFATMLQTTLYDRLRRVNRNLKNLGVKQAPFMVLIGATMPSVLAEIAFISNRQEADLLKTEKYRQQIAEALLAGVMRYQQSLKKASTVASK